MEAVEKGERPERAEEIIGDGRPLSVTAAGGGDSSPQRGEPRWCDGEPPRDGRYFARIDMKDGRIHETAAEYRGANWFVFNSPLHLSFKVLGWWPLPERETIT